MRRRQIAQFVEIGGKPFDLAGSFSHDAGTDQHQIRPQRIHQLELAPRPLEGSGAQGALQALKIPKGLETDAVKAVVRQHPGRLGRRQVPGHQIILENLDGLETGRRYGLELFLKRALQGDGGDGFQHLLRL